MQMKVTKPLSRLILQRAGHSSPALNINRRGVVSSGCNGY